MSLSNLPNSIDPNLIPTYEGGDPARYCHPKGGYPTYAGEGVRFKPGIPCMSHDGEILVTNERLYKKESTLRLLDEIEERKKNYGRKPDTHPASPG